MLDKHIPIQTYYKDCRLFDQKSTISWYLFQPMNCIKIMQQVNSNVYVINEKKKT